MASSDPTTVPKPVIVVVRDGWGRNPNPDHHPFNAVKLANTPHCDALLERYPSTLIHTSGEDVGLPEGTMGNSEVGHQNIGAGRVVDQDSVRITKSIRTGEFFENHALCDTVEDAKKHGGAVHILGIASDAGVHGLLDHLYACVELCAKRDMDRVYLHLFTDGRDTPPKSGKQYLADIEAKLREIGVGRIASICGRYYAMDRDNRWERVHTAYRLLTEGCYAPEIGNYKTAGEAIQDYYDNPTNDSQEGDEFVLPRTIAPDGDATDSRIKDGDAVIFYNYRGDRPRELTRAFCQPDFHGNVKPSPDSGEQGFDRSVHGKPQLNLAGYVCMTAYDETFYNFPMVRVAFDKPPKMKNIGGEYLANLGKTQFRCAETEKFPHVTFFANDYREEPFEGETREIVQSPKVATYDLQPEMSAEGVTQEVLKRIRGDGVDVPDFILVNYANGDMVGHTGKLDAAIKAVETVDQCVGRLVDATLQAGGRLIVTADHGNAEQMRIPEDDSAHTAHTTYDVECIIVHPDLDANTKLRENGRLADIFPTALKLMGLEKPDEMTGQSLVL